LSSSAASLDVGQASIIAVPKTRENRPTEPAVPELKTDTDKTLYAIEALSLMMRLCRHITR
jgi:hypothetical protein